MDVGVSHFTISPIQLGASSSEVVKLDLSPRVGSPDQQIDLYDLFDLMKVIGRHNSLPAALDLNSSDYSDIFQMFEMLKHLAG